MTIRTYTKSILIAALVTISLGGLGLHLRIHTVAQNPSNWANLIPGILSVLIVPLLFSFKKTIHWGYVLNGMMVIIGTIAMAHLSFVKHPIPLSAGSLILKTTLPDIVILWCKFFVGKALFDLELFGYDHEKTKKGVWWRYPHLGWWWIHVVVIATVYAVGHLLWRRM